MLNDREAFKAGFLKRCADEGLSAAESIDLVKQANSEMEKMSSLSKIIAKLMVPFTPIYEKGLNLGLGAALLGPPAAGVAGSYLYSRATDSDDTDEDTARKKELAEAYRDQAAKIVESRRRYASS